MSTFTSHGRCRRRIFTHATSISTCPESCSTIIPTSPTSLPISSRDKLCQPGSQNGFPCYVFGPCSRLHQVSEQRFWTIHIVTDYLLKSRHRRCHRGVPQPDSHHIRFTSFLETTLKQLCYSGLLLAHHCNGLSDCNSSPHHIHLHQDRGHLQHHSGYSNNNDFSCPNYGHPGSEYDHHHHVYHQGSGTLYHYRYGDCCRQKTCLHLTDHYLGYSLLFHSGSRQFRCSSLLLSIHYHGLPDCNSCLDYLLHHGHNELVQ